MSCSAVAVRRERDDAAPGNVGSPIGQRKRQQSKASPAMHLNAAQ